ncbi:hypothetical protein [Mycobacterium sp. NPDC050853]|uniref:hypothetical protein n=1 Tax=Mycobacterium sp. NPDC050853 TaxID=3155160 RepID=UPI0034032CD0
MSAIQRSAGVVTAAARGAVRAVNPVSADRRWPGQVNDWTERAHPNGRVPVVLVPGSFVPGQFYWHGIAPMLISEGHPVFACNLPGWVPGSGRDGFGVERLCGEGQECYRIERGSALAA